MVSWLKKTVLSCLPVLPFLADLNKHLSAPLWGQGSSWVHCPP